MRIARMIKHSIVDIRALMIEEFGKGDHRRILKVLSKAPGDEVRMQPNNVFFWDGTLFEKFGIIF